MNPLILLSILAITPEKQYKSSDEFLHRHGVTVQQVCKRFKATNCVLKREANAYLDELGLATESGTFKWCLYGRKKK